MEFFFKFSIAHEMNLYEYQTKEFPTILCITIINIIILIIYLYKPENTFYIKKVDYR